MECYVVGSRIISKVDLQVRQNGHIATGFICQRKPGFRTPKYDVVSTVARINSQSFNLTIIVNTFGEVGMDCSDEGDTACGARPQSELISLVSTINPQRICARCSGIEYGNG